MADPETMGERIYASRKALGLDQQDVADELDVNRSTVSMWENDRAEPTSANMSELARILRRTEAWIRYGDQPAGGRSTRPTPSDIREEQASYRVVPVDETGGPLEDELEALRAWLPDEAIRRLSRHSTARAWLGMLYAHGIDEGWPKERLDRIDAARRRVDAV